MTAPDWVMNLPALNASLNGLATVLLLVGYKLIRKGQRDAHKRTMLAAYGVSIAFLVSYLTYHALLHKYTGESGQKFQGTGAIRYVYFTILISHIILAVPTAVMATMTIYRGLKANWEGHKRIARITYPIWLYVSVTGVIIYLMLYHWPQG